jgi:ribosomal protein L15E
MQGPWVLGIVAVVGWFAYDVRTSWRSFVARRRSKKATDGERAAEGLLANSGYTIIDRQVPKKWKIHVDGEARTVRLRADLMVRKGGRRYIAEVKTGAVAPSIESPDTRRQLLEYRIAYHVDGVLLVDMEHGQIREVRFGFPAGHRAEWFLAGVLGGLFAIGAAIHYLR